MDVLPGEYSCRRQFGAQPRDKNNFYIRQGRARYCRATAELRALEVAIETRMLVIKFDLRLADGLLTTMYLPTARFRRS
jgi:hypothetical protein